MTAHNLLELLDSPHAIVVIRKLGKDRLTEVEEMAMEEALSYREAARQGNVAAEMLFWKYLGLALEAAKARAPYESPRLAAVAVQEQPDEADTAAALRTGPCSPSVPAVA